jgi:hypothetical protein
MYIFEIRSGYWPVPSLHIAPSAEAMRDDIPDWTMAPAQLGVVLGSFSEILTTLESDPAQFRRYRSRTELPFACPYLSHAGSPML